MVAFVTANLEAIAFYTSVTAAALGLLAFALVALGWSWLRPHYREFWPKFAVALFRVVTASSAIVAKTLPTEPERPFWQQPWASTILIAAFGYLFWEVAGAVGDYKSKRAKEKNDADHAKELEIARQDREDAEFAALRLNWLLTHLRHPVNEKRRRIRRTTQTITGSRVSIQQVREGLAAGDQARILLELLAALFHFEAVQRDRDRYNQNFRVGLFVESDGYLKPAIAFDLATRNVEPFSSYEEYADRYRLDNDTNPSQAVRCVREGRTIIVPDCLADVSFEFFNDRQRQYLRSLVAFPLSDFSPDGTAVVGAALLVDTNEPGFFREDDREVIETRLNEFALRIALEYLVGGLVGSMTAL